jgi:tripartite-type tricarboxylate transporter receptor subunit TctC
VELLAFAQKPTMADRDSKPGPRREEEVMHARSAPAIGVSCWLAAALVLLASITARSAAADPVEDFYRGKSINLYISSTPGAGYDVYARLMARFMGEHIPGRPTIVPRNMAGGEGRIAAGYVYNVAAPDGLSLAALNRSVALAQAMGDSNLKFDIARFNWIGNPASDNSTLVTWHTTGIATIADAQAKEVTIGATGDGNSSIYPKVLNTLDGTRFKIISGYPGGNEINLAMENGEVGGRGDNAWSSWKSGKPEWLRDRKINILVQVGLKPSPDLSGVPLMSDLARNDDDRQLMLLLSAPSAIGHPIATGPNVPAERVAALRHAFDATIVDPAFLEEAKRLKKDINPVSGADLQRIVEEILATPEPIRARLAGLVLGGDKRPQ